MDIMRAPLLVLSLVFGIITGSDSAPLPHESSIVLHLDASTLPAGQLETWHDQSSAGNDASQSVSFFRPVVAANARHCQSIVQFAQHTLTVPDDDTLSPEDEPFAFFVVSREGTTSEANVMAKPNTFLAEWRVGHGGAGGGLSTVESYSSSTFACAARTKGNTNTKEFQVWGGVLGANEGPTTTRLLDAYLEGSNAGWQSRWSGCSSVTQGTVSGTGSLSIGTLQYTGEIAEIVVWKGVALSTADVQNITTTLQNKYYFFCPDLQATPNALSTGECDGRTQAESCTQSCSSPFVRTAGTILHNCDSGQWTGLPIRCELQCPTLALPADATYCSKTLDALSFDAASHLSKFQASPPIPALLFDEYWRLAGGGGTTSLYTGAGNQCRPTDLSYSVLHYSDPLWAASMEPGQFVRASVSVSVTSGAVGIVMRYTDEDNHLFFQFTDLHQVVFGTRIGGVDTPQQPLDIPVPVPATLDVVITVDGTTFSVNVTNVPGAAASWTEPDGTLVSGVAGFLSDGVGTFDDFELVTTCDGGGTQCSTSSSGMECEFGCGVGYTVDTGNTLRECYANGTWSGAPLSCKILPPEFYPQTRNVSENVPANTPVGAPLDATVITPEVAVTFVIVEGRDDLFKIGVCDGLVRTRLDDSLDHEGVDPPVFVLTIAARSNGIARSQTVANITIDVLDVPEPPVFAEPSFSRIVPEDQAGGDAFGAPLTATDPERAPLTYSVVPGTTGAAVFDINATTAVLFLRPGASLDFETTSSYSLGVKVEDPSGLTAFASGAVLVADVDEPPFAAPIEYQYIDIDAVPGLSLNPPVTAIDPENSGLTYSLRPPATTFMAINDTTGLLTLTQALGYSVQVTVDFVDGGGLSGAVNVTLTLLPLGTARITGISPAAEEWFASTQGNDTVTFAGTGFYPSLIATATYGNAETGLFYTASDCEVQTLTEITCRTVPGFGENLQWEVRVNGSRVRLGDGVPASTIATSYSPPADLVITDARVVSSLGGAHLTIQGQNMFPNCSFVAATIGRFLMTPVSCGFTQLVVRVPAGAGANLTVSVNFRSLTSTSLQFLTPATPLVSYAPPAISTVSSFSLPTVGGTRFVVTGSGFGPSDAAVAVTYSSSAGVSYTAAACSHNGGNADSQIICTSVPGVGSDLAVTVAVEGVASAVKTDAGSYRAPQLFLVGAAVAGQNPNDFNTAGGQLVLLRGLNFGPPGSTFVTQVTYGPSASEYTARDCAVLTDAIGGSSLQCTTVPGTGAGHLWRVFIADLPSGAAGTTSYGAPALASFTGPGAANADTEGNQLVFLNGLNFGPMTGSPLPPNSTVYRVDLFPPPSNATLPFNPISPATDGLVTFHPQDCEVVTAHTRIQCRTSPGGGTGLQWTVIIDGQANKDLLTSYAAPAVTDVTLMDGSTAPTGANALSTRGGTSLLLHGSNFGPPSASGASLVQYVRYGPNAQFSVEAFSVTSHSTITVDIGPGVGTNMAFVVSVADQLSPVSLATFDYLPPVVTGLSPFTGPTVPTSPDGDALQVDVTGTNFGLSLASASFQVLLGNPEDASQVTLTADRVSQSATNETLRFTLPRGLGADRAVQVLVSDGRLASLAASSDPTADGTAALFSYFPPAVKAALSVPAQGAAELLAAQRLLGPGVPLTAVRRITVEGTNFGRSPLDSPDTIERELQAQPYDEDDPTIDPAAWSSDLIKVDFEENGWSDTAVVGYTTEPSAHVRIVIKAKRYASGSDVVSQSAATQYILVSPTIDGAIAATGGFSTDGTDRLVISVAHMGNAGFVKSIEVQVTPPVLCPGPTTTCPIIDPVTGEVLNSSAVGPWLHRTYGVRSVYNLSCIMPPGQGVGAAVRIVRDFAPSNAVLLDYAPPVIESTQVFDSSRPGYNPPKRPASAGVRSPTTTGRMIIHGTNFGITPVVFVAVANPVPFPAAGPNHNASYLTMDVPHGEGVDWSMRMQVCGQWSPALAFAYLPPSLESMATTNHSTSGGEEARLTGFNFGVGNGTSPDPTVQLVKGSLVLPCTLRSRSDTEVRFIVPPASGRGWAVVLTVSYGSHTATGRLDDAFHYAPPTITSMTARGQGFNGSDVTVAVNGTGPRAVLTGTAGGGFVLDISGTNFGPPAPLMTTTTAAAVGAADTVLQFCVFLRWRGAADTSPLALACDGMLTYIGEGEVPPLDVTHTHTTARVVVPAGMGTADVVVWVSGQVPPNLGVFQYNVPTLTSMPALLSTNGDEPITIRGRDFGPVTGDLPSATLFEPVALPVPNSLAPVTALLRLQFGPAHKCIYTPPNYAGVPVPDTLQACGTNITSRQNDALELRTLSGIGLNLTLTMEVIEPDNTVSPAVTRVLAAATALPFAFHRPSVTFLNPSVMTIDTRDSGYQLQVRGEDFGLQEDVQHPSTPPEWRTVNININGVDCPDPRRVNEIHPTLGPIALLTCSMKRRVVGYKNFTITAAGQASTTLEADPAFNTLHVVCAREFYGLPGYDCLPCPDGAVCAGFVNGDHSPPVPIEGWYNMNGTVINDTFTGETLFDLCPDARGDVSRPEKVCVVPCEPAEACLGNNLCAGPYTDTGPSYRCSSCAEGFYRLSGECVTCPDNPWVLIVVFLLIAILLCVGGWILSRKNVNIAFLAIGIDYFQVLALFANSRAQWPQLLEDVLNVLRLFQFDIGITAPECALPSLGYETKWWGIMQLPVAAMTLLVLIFVATFFYKWLCVRERKRARLTKHKSVLIGMSFVIGYVLYLFITSTVLDIFNCQPTDPPDGREYLEVAFVECGTGLQKRLVPWASMYLIVYCIGFPSLVAVILFQNRLTIMEDQLLAAKNTGGTRLTNPNAYDFRKKFHKLYYLFKPSYFFWVLIILGRKFGLAFTGLMFSKNPTFQLAIALLIMFIGYALQVRYRPYMSPSDRPHVLRHHHFQALQGGVHSTLAVRLQEIEKSGRKATRKLGLSTAAGSDASAIVSVALYLNNYNTVESVLLFSAVLVNLSGIMFESRRLQSASFQTQRDTVAVIVLIVIFSTLAYFFVVVIAEIRAIYKEGRFKSGKAQVGLKDVKRIQRTTRAVEMADLTQANRAAGRGGGHDAAAANVVQSQMNPMFAKMAAAAQLSGGPMSADQAAQHVNHEQIIGMTELPSPTAWALIRNSYSDLVDQIEGLSKQVSSLKRQAEMGADGPGAGAAGDGAGGRRRVPRTRRRTFVAPPQHVATARAALARPANPDAKADAPRLTPATAARPQSVPRTRSRGGSVHSAVDRNLEGGDVSEV